ncbi:MAG: GNAT family N-acetyltransferase [Oscillospiraceae bacterium]|nr:GNAT family N-acetyltransferase [Oscillospiraceae bacterium]
MIHLKCQDIVVREFEEKDIENKVKWINDPKNNEYLHYDLPLEYEKTLLWYQNKAQNRLDCVIEYDDIPVGLVGLISIDNVSLKAEFYISMGETTYKGKGIATTATKLLLQYAFKVLNLNKIYLNVDEENSIACRLYQKCGFRKEGRFEKDLWHRGRLINRLRYAIFAEDFREYYSQSTK